MKYERSVTENYSSESNKLKLDEPSKNHKLIVMGDANVAALWSRIQSLVRFQSCLVLINLILNSSKENVSTILLSILNFFAMITILWKPKNALHFPIIAPQRSRTLSSFPVMWRMIKRVWQRKWKNCFNNQIMRRIHPPNYTNWSMQQRLWILAFTF